MKGLGLDISLAFFISIFLLSAWKPHKAQASIEK